MRVGSVDIQTVGDCLDILEAAFQSPIWEQLPEEDKIRLVGRLTHVLEIAEGHDLKR